MAASPHPRRRSSPRILPALAVLPDSALPWLVLVAVCVLHLPLVFNPGYYSHDELQWAARAAGIAGQPPAWFAWTAIDTYQYRPLTFNLWLWLSRHLFAHPFGFHVVCVAWGAANAALLASVGRRFGMAPWQAACGALAFALGPYAAYVHGWVGTLADLAWLSCALGIAWCVLARPRIATAIVSGLLLTTAGLLAKEAAITIPPLLATAWLFDRTRRGAWFAATCASALVVVVYLALRFDALLQPAPEGVQYVLSPWHAPLRWIEYQLFAQVPNVVETFALLKFGVDLRIVLAGLMWCVLLAALWRAGPRFVAMFLLGGVAALAAVLPLGSSWNHYGYAFAAVTAMVVASAWRTAPRWGRWTIGVFAFATLLHGFGIVWIVRQAGVAQSVFSPALARAVAAHEGDARVRLVIAPDARYWVFHRLVHEIPSYRGVAIGDRVGIVESAAQADYRIEADGRLTPLRRRSNAVPDVAR